MKTKAIKTALISVFDKTGIDEIVKYLDNLNVKIYSTGGTLRFIEDLGIKVSAVEDLTGYPSILDGRVKTLHPKVFGGILARTDFENDLQQAEKYGFPFFDLVIVDLYPFEKTLQETDNHSDIIEKIDIGGISLIRAAAKNYADVLVIPSKEYYPELVQILKNGGETSVEQRKFFAAKAFAVSSKYDTAIWQYFADDDFDFLRIAEDKAMDLRYGENPHQKARFFGDFDEIFEQLHGKKISYNNLLDISSAVDLISEFDELTLAILKHTNACGLASRSTLLQAWKDALAGDPVSAFGGIIVTNVEIDKQTAEEINKIFYEVIIAPAYSEDALKVLMSKKNRIILRQKKQVTEKFQVRSVLNGYLKQEKDRKIVDVDDFKFVTDKRPDDREIEDLIFANKIVKNSKSNAIVLVKNKRLVGSGVGETSRVDALKHAIEKAKNFGLELQGAVMSSDAFFPFSDSVEIAHKEGITAVIQPGGSIRDKDSIEFCNANGMSMVFTGFRHFKH